MMPSRRGFTIIEVIITIAVLAVGLLVIISSFSMNLREATQSRSHLLGALVLENLTEEVLAHPYGQAAPSSWIKGQVDFEVVVEGKPVKSSFVQSVSTSPKGNGSFLGAGKGNQDEVRLEVHWTEASGEGGSGIDKHLTVDLTVGRQP